MADMTTLTINGVTYTVKDAEASALARFALPGSLKWDGVIGDREYVKLGENDDAIYAYVYMGDSDLLARTIQPGANITALFAENEYGVISAGEVSFDVAEDGFAVIGEVILYIPSDDYTLEDLTFPKRGIYFFAISLLPAGYDASAIHVTALSFLGYPNAFPDTDGGVTSWNDLEDRPFYDEIMNVENFIYNGSFSFSVDSDGTSVEGGALAMASTEDLTNKTITFTINGDSTELQYTATEGLGDIFSDASGEIMLTYDPAGQIIIVIANAADTLGGKTVNLAISYSSAERVLKQLPPKYIPGYDVTYKTTDTIEWDGVVGDRTNVSWVPSEGMINMLVKISDDVPDKSWFDEEYTITAIVSDGEQTLTEAGVTEGEGYYAIGDLIIVCTNAGAIVDDVVTLPETGIYFLKSTMDSANLYVSRLQLADPFIKSDEPDTFTLNEEHLPTTVPVIPTASVGQLIRVKAVDDAGVPTEWETVENIAENITETTTTNEITWDGVVGDRPYAVIMEGFTMVRVSDYVPDMAALMQSGCIVVHCDAEEGEITFEVTAANMVAISDTLYMIGEIVFVVTEDGVSFIEDGATVTFPKKGVYFLGSLRSDYINYTKSIHSPALSVPTTKIKESALPGAAILYADDENYLYATEDTSDTSKRITCGELQNVLMSCRVVYIHAILGGAATYMTFIAFAVINGVGMIRIFDGDMYYTAEYTAT